MALEQVLLQFGGLGVIAILFGVVIKWLLKHVDTLVKTNRDIAEKFDVTITNHLAESSKTMQELTFFIKSLNGSISKRHTDCLWLESQKEKRG